MCAEVRIPCRVRQKRLGTTHFRDSQCRDSRHANGSPVGGCRLVARASTANDQTNLLHSPAVVSRIQESLSHSNRPCALQGREHGCNRRRWPTIITTNDGTATNATSNQTNAFHTCNVQEMYPSLYSTQSTLDIGNYSIWFNCSEQKEACSNRFWQANSCSQLCEYTNITNRCSINGAINSVPHDDDWSSPTMAPVHTCAAANNQPTLLTYSCARVGRQSAKPDRFRLVAPIETFRD